MDVGHTIRKRDDSFVRLDILVGVAAVALGAEPAWRVMWLN